MKRFLLVLSVLAGLGLGSAAWGRDGGGHSYSGSRSSSSSSSRSSSSHRSSSSSSSSRSVVLVLGSLGVFAFVPGLEALKQREPGFDEAAFLTRATHTFVDIQHAWSTACSATSRA